MGDTTCANGAIACGGDGDIIVCVCVCVCSPQRVWRRRQRPRPRHSEFRTATATCTAPATPSNASSPCSPQPAPPAPHQHHAPRPWVLSSHAKHRRAPHLRTRATPCMSPLAQPFARRISPTAPAGTSAHQRIAPATAHRRCASQARRECTGGGAQRDRSATQCRCGDITTNAPIVTQRCVRRM